MPEIFGVNMFDPDCEICGKDLSTHGSGKTDCPGRFTLTLEEINKILVEFMAFKKIMVMGEGEEETA